MPIVIKSRFAVVVLAGKAQGVVDGLHAGQQRDGDGLAEAREDQTHSARIV
jgi:hypothetical protein